MKVMVTGHRPTKTGGYQTPNPTEQWVRANLRNILTGLQKKHRELIGITGMALGVDTIFAEVCIELKIPFIAAVPFEDQGNRWPQESQDHYKKVLAQARQRVVVDQIAKYHSDHFHGKMLQRNQWMLDNSRLTIAVWNKSPGGTANTVMLARKLRRKILMLNPKDFVVDLEKPAPKPKEGLSVLEMFGE